jgi:hypothetical protein
VVYCYFLNVRTQIEDKSGDTKDSFHTNIYPAFDQFPTC